MTYPLDRDILILPDVLLVDDGTEEQPIAEATLRPVFDALWQAFGVVGSPNYSNDGKRIVR